ncbi:P-loop containing nucleoside triphosphate hydrolase protein [Mycena maculata]|uniref:P-loop containing nucleoside triphosphate hydrolase protein n=1 Tax=Mycena maculata TaxID=230809 RepID=A0AAD7HH99_9AGAR|nr:P-loop containing nucleoside triphosphate hydrolase protein [Mycena maculata]
MAPPPKDPAMKEEKQLEAETIPEKTTPVLDYPPIGIAGLFRYATETELLINLVGVAFAVGAGASQILMVLFFGNLTLDFERFGAALNDGSSSVSSAAAAFRSAAAIDASHIVYTGLGVLVGTYGYMITFVYTGEAISKRIREKYLAATLKQDITYFDSIGPGEILSRIQSDSHLIQEGISEKIGHILSFAASFLTGYIVAYVKCWQLALALSSILPFISISSALMNKFIVKYTTEVAQHTATAGTIAEEVISTIRTSHAFGTQKIMADMYGSFTLQSIRARSKGALVSGISMGVIFFTLYSSYGLAFYFGGTLILGNQANVSDVVTCLFGIVMGTLSMTSLPPNIQALATACGSATKIFATIDRIPSIDSSSPDGLKSDSVEGDIRLKDVNFSYPSRPEISVLKDTSLHFPAGQTTALVGMSGSGKSTVIALVERFYDPLGGTVELDGIDLKSLNVRWLRSQIGLVSQEPVLFATTIRENVAHGLINTEYEHSPPEEKLKLIKQACVQSNAASFIESLPNGYETMVGERGFLLSGGQKQRIAIARAIVSDPAILLLDEATSALDTQSEGIVQDALDKAASGRTTIVIAHRLSTVRNADSIYVMANGRPLERGTHSELITLGGVYSDLVNAQQVRDGSENEGIGDSVAENKFPSEKNLTHGAQGKQLLTNKNPSEAKKERKYSIPTIARRFLSVNSEQRLEYLLAFSTAALCGCVQPALGVIFAKALVAYSDTTKGGLRHDTSRDALWFFIISIASGILQLLQTKYLMETSAALCEKLRLLNFKAILRQDIAFFDQEENNLGALTSGLSDNPQKILTLTGMTLGTIVQALATLVGGLILGWVFAWKIGLVALACTPILVVGGFVRFRVLVLRGQESLKAHAASAQLACEAAAAIRTVASLTREQDCCDAYSRSLEGPLRASNRSSIWTSAVFAFCQSATLFVTALVFWFGSVQVSHQEYTVFEFFVGLMCSTFAAITAGTILQNAPDLSAAKIASQNILTLVDSVPEIDTNSKEGRAIDNTNLSGRVSFTNVHFCYPTRPTVPVLRGLEFTAEPGQFIALVGHSGCGKSTVVQLIERYYNPLDGEITLDGQNVSTLAVQDYRKHISLVSQEPTLYTGTIRFNILLGSVKPQENVTQEEIEEACRQANILDFIRDLPEGFETQVGGKGSQLSGGQKQRIAIARALLRNPKILLLDEATSALDSKSEEVVQAALDQAAKGRTTIAIAHRLSTIQNADKIYFIREGQVSEEGTHNELMARRGDYYGFVKLQALDG